MNDREFLIWLHARLTEVHGESPYVDYMQKLRAIITSIPADKHTPNNGRGCNTLEKLEEKLKQEEAL